MKRKVSAANLSIAITFLLILLSFGFGYRSYSQAEQRVVSDLNQALQRTVLQNKGLWLNADTIQTYAKLQEVMGTPVSVSGSHRAFTEALSVTGLKDVSTLSLHILKKNAPATVFNEIPAGCLASDTLVWLSTTADASGLTLSFRGYARCQLPCCSVYPSRQFRQHCYWPPSSGEDSPFSISVGAQGLMLILVTGNSRKTPSLSTTFRFPSRKPASIMSGKRN